MKKIIITILALVVLSLSLMSQDVVFKTKGDTKDPDVSGHVYIWSESQHAWVVATDGNYTIYIRLYYNNSNSEAFEDIVYSLPNNGYYEDYFWPHQDYHNCDLLEVECEGYIYQREYQYPNHYVIDVYVGHGPYPTPDNTIPAEK